MVDQMPPFLNLIKLFWQNRKFLFLFNITIIFSSIIVSLLMPKWYKADVRILIHEENKTDYAISSMLQGLPISLGATKNDVIIDRNKAILNSKDFLDKVIDQFQLENNYKVKYREQIYPALRQDLFLIDNKDGTFSVIGYYKNDAKLAAELVEFVTGRLTEKNIQISQSSARAYRNFMEETYKRVSSELESVENQLVSFQKENDVIQVDEQAKESIKMIANLEVKKIELELQLNFLQQNYEDNHPNITAIQTQISLLQNKIEDLKRNKNYSNIALNTFPDNYMSYMRHYREVFIHEKILEIIVPQLEKAKIDEAKNVTNLIIIDPVKVPQLKAKPKRTAIVVLSTFFSLVISLIIIYLNKSYKSNKENISLIFKQ